MAKIYRCRSCSSSKLDLILDLGEMPLANALLTEQQISLPEPRFSLGIVFCNDCSLVQITETIDPQKLFSEYAYFSSFSDTLLIHSEHIANRMIAERELNAGSRVIEIASNDGYLLQYYKKANIPVLGIEPAKNIAAVANDRGITTLCDFFDEALGRRLVEENQRADVIHANNVFAHVPDINSFLQGLHHLLKDDGVAVVEFPYVREMIERVEFDTIYHEHVFYFSITAVQNACERNGLNIVHVERLSIHGGSVRVFIQKIGKIQASVKQILEEERDFRLDEFSAYKDFGRRVENLKQDLCRLISRLKHEGKRIAAYGAAAKGSTLLNFIQIGCEQLDFVADRSTVKQGHFMPGIHLPIVAAEELLNRKPDYVLLLTWNFAEEILKQQKEYLAAGGSFIIPIPQLRIIDNTGLRNQRATVPIAH